MTKRAYNNVNRAQKSLQTRATIVKTMVAAMADGEDDISVADVARQSGVSVRTVYQYFPDKAARAKAISEWVDKQVDISEVLPRNYTDVPQYIERLVDYVLDNETLIRAQMAPGLSKTVRTYRKRVHAGRLRKVLRERFANRTDIDYLTALILSTVRAEAVLDMRDIYGLTVTRIKSGLRTMIAGVLADFETSVSTTP